MADIGIRIEADELVLTRGRDFKWVFENIDENGAAIPFPAGELFFELKTTPAITRWDFVIEGTRATIKIEHEQADLIPARTSWQLVFLPDGEAAGGDPVARGKVTEQK